MMWMKKRKGVREMMLAGMMGNLDRFGDFGSGNDSGWNGMADVMREMMAPYRSGGGQVYWQFHWVLELATWGLVIALMIAAFRWLWKKGDEAGKK